VNRNFAAPQLNVAMLGLLVSVSALSSVSILSSGHETYVPPAPIAEQYTDFTAPSDPRGLSLSTSVVYALGRLKNGSREEQIGRQPLVADNRRPTFLVGWSIDTVDDRPSLAVYTRIDAGPIHHFPLTIPRPDVTRLYHSPLVLDFGFSAPLDLSREQPGRHQLTVWLTTSDGLAAARPESILLRIARRGAQPR
jgi:hypothetical protein